MLGSETVAPIEPLPTAVLRLLIAVWRAENLLPSVFISVNWFVSPVTSFCICVMGRDAIATARSTADCKSAV